MRKRQRGDFAQRQHFRAAEFVGAPGRARVADAASRRQRDVADEDRLQLRRAAAEQRQRRQGARERGEAVEEIVLRTEHDRRAQDDRVGERLAHGGLAAPLAGDIGLGDRASAPTPETWTSVSIPAAAAARAISPAPIACTAS